MIMPHNALHDHMKRCHVDSADEIYIVDVNWFNASGYEHLGSSGNMLLQVAPPGGSTGTWYRYYGLMCTEGCGQVFSQKQQWREHNEGMLCKRWREHNNVTYISCLADLVGSDWLDNTGSGWDGTKDSRQNHNHGVHVSAYEARTHVIRLAEPTPMELNTVEGALDVELNSFSNIRSSIA